MTIYRLPQPLEAPDRFAIAILPMPELKQAPELRFETFDGELVLAIRFEPARKKVALSTLGYEGVILPDMLLDRPNLTIGAELRVDVVVEADVLSVDFGEKCSTTLRGALPPTSIGIVRIIAADVQSFYHMKSLLHAINWRHFAEPSGCPSTTNPFANNDQLIPGVSFIVRAKNEADNIAACLSGIAPFAQDVVFVDNGSTDETLKIAESVAATHSNIRVFSYPVRVPRVGREHAEAVMARSKNTLGEYYNWALSKANCFNFTKWDADFLTIPHNMSEMYDSLDLASRGDNICLYYSGMEVYTDGQGWWVDVSTMQHEYRLFSKLHRCSWVDIQPWEELDQTYLYKSRKIYYEKPIYLELFRLNRDEFASRGLYLRDARDRARYGYLQHYTKYGELPGNFMQVSGPSDPVFAEMKLTSEHQRMRARAHAIWSSVPVVYRGSHNVIDPGLRMQQTRLLVLIVSCEKNAERREKIRVSWAEDLARLGLTYYFVIGRPDHEQSIVGDVLYLDCPDTYEGLPSKTEAMLSFFMGKTSFDFMLKIDDDIVLDADRINDTEYYKHNYFGGVVAGSWGLQADWHFGKCSKVEMNETLYSGGFLGTWYAGGCGYFLSRMFAEKALSRQEIFAAEFYEDKAVGDALRLSGALRRDLHSTFNCVNARELTEFSVEPHLLVFDVPENVDYADVLRTLKSTTRPTLLPPALAASFEPSANRVVTDWCHADEFFKNELASEVFGE